MTFQIPCSLFLGCNDICYLDEQGNYAEMTLQCASAAKLAMDWKQKTEKQTRCKHAWSGPWTQDPGPRSAVLAES